jgi:hypothetical protein
MQQAPGERGRRRGRGDEPQPPSPQIVMDIFSGLSMRRRVFLFSTVAGFGARCGMKEAGESATEERGSERCSRCKQGGCAFSHSFGMLTPKTEAAWAQSLPHVALLGPYSAAV